MTEAEEKFVHYCECCESMNAAWHLLKALSRCATKDAVYEAAYSFALIEYCKSHTTSDGVHRSWRNAYKLEPPKLSPEKMKLHKQILDLRHRCLAHSELKLKEARIEFGRGPFDPTYRITKKAQPALPPLEDVQELVRESMGLMFSGIGAFLKPRDQSA